MPKKARAEVVNPYRPHTAQRGSENVCGMSPGVLLLAGALLLTLALRFHDVVHPAGRVLPRSAFAEDAVEEEVKPAKKRKKDGCRH